MGILEISLAFIRVGTATFLLGCALVGYFVRNISWGKHLYLGLAAIGLFTVPEFSQFSWVCNLAGLVVASVILMPELPRHRAAHVGRAK